MQKYIVTGSAGFIGMHLCNSLLKEGYEVCGIDNLNSYYSISLKKDRINELVKYPKFIFHKVDVIDKQKIEEIFSEFKPTVVINLAAQAGVRYSLKNPNAYISANILGFMNILEACRIFNVQSLIYASSSSVYGGNNKMPFSIKDPVNKPTSIYAVTKRANELMAYSYSQLYSLRTTGLRLFTVYGPWGRPDMAMYIFADSIIDDKPIKLFNYGKMKRDFTYIDDIISGIRLSIEKNYKCEIFNLGYNQANPIINVVKIIEKHMGKKALIDFTDIQPGDVQATFSDIDYTKQKLNYSPKVSINKGVPNFLSWHKKYHNY